MQFLTAFKIQDSHLYSLALPGRDPEVHEDVVHLLDPQGVQVGEETDASDPAHHVRVVYQRVEHLRAGDAGQASSSDVADGAVRPKTEVPGLWRPQSPDHPLDHSTWHPTTATLEVGVLAEAESGDQSVTGGVEVRSVCKRRSEVS